jgi:hypothetical protein
VSLLKSRPPRLICILRTDQLSAAHLRISSNSTVERSSPGIERIVKARYSPSSYLSCTACRMPRVRWFGILSGTVRSCLRTHRELALENLALRQQLAVWKARESRPRLTELDRIFWVCLSRLWTRWRQSLQLMRPETVVGWHRQGFRRYWAWKSRRRSGRPAISADLRDLIRRMSSANPLWGAPRIHGELPEARHNGIPSDCPADVRELFQIDPVRFRGVSHSAPPAPVTIQGQGVRGRRR